MSNISNRLMNEYDSRIREIAIIKSLSFSGNLKSFQEDIYNRYAVVALYALLEGFVVASFNTYIRELNLLKLDPQKICIELVTFSIDNKCEFHNQRIEIKTKIKLVENIENFIYNKFNIKVIEKTSGNIRLNFLNMLLYYFKLNKLPEKPYRRYLNDLLRFRNDIAHGSFSIPVMKSHVNDFSIIVQDIMAEIATRIEDGYNNRTYERI